MRITWAPLPNVGGGWSFSDVELQLVTPLATIGRWGGLDHDVMHGSGAMATTRSRSSLLALLLGLVGLLASACGTGAEATPTPGASPRGLLAQTETAEPEQPGLAPVSGIPVQGAPLRTTPTVPDAELPAAAAGTPISRPMPPLTHWAPLPHPVEPAPPPTEPPAPPEQPQEIVYRADGGLFPNPERGWYVQDSPFWIGDQRGVVDMDDLRSQGVTMIRLYFVIDEFRTSSIDADALALIEANFTEARESGVKVIPRFSYNFPTNGDYQNALDADLEQTLAHIRQLGPILSRNSDVIAYMNLGFVGAWGEWHSSSNNHVGEGRSLNDGARRIIDEIMRVLPDDRMATMRYPDYKRQLYGGVPLSADEAHDGSARARMGGLNDCFLASATDWGTYPGDATEREAIKSFLSSDNQFVVMGGETCNEGDDALPFIGCSNALSELARTRWSALHNGYHQGVLDRWQAEGCYDDIGRQLGYRLELLSGTYPRSVEAGGTMAIDLSLRNVGFAAPYNPRSVELVLRNQANGSETTVTVAADPRTWLPGEHRLQWSVPVPANLAAGNYSLLLNLPDPEPALNDRADYAIHLANVGTWEASTGYNNLGLSVTVN